MKAKVDLLVIDPQNDFMDTIHSALPVAGASDDMKRLSGMVDQFGHKFSRIHITMDSHHLIHIAHPLWWKDKDGNHPSPGTIITPEMVAKGDWNAYRSDLRKYSETYVNELEKRGRYNLCIWRPHCLIGTWGHNVEENLNAALQKWASSQFATVDYVTKGSNPFTEHYGALMAEVPDPKDPTTSMNAAFLQMMQKADVVLIAGEALSHCVKETVDQIADNIGEKHISKFHILTDCSSPIPAIPGADFPAIAQEWLKEMKQRGVGITTSQEFFS